MLEPGTNTRTHPVARHAGVALSGVAADGRQVALRAQGEALGYKNTYGSPIPGKILCDRVASYVHAFNLYWYVRPFGCVTLLATFDDEEGPALYAIDPAGGAFVSLLICFLVFCVPLCFFRACFRVLVRERERNGEVAGRKLGGRKRKRKEPTHFWSCSSFCSLSSPLLYPPSLLLQKTSALLRHRRREGAPGGQDRDREAQPEGAQVRAGARRGREDVSGEFLFFSFFSFFLAFFFSLLLLSLFSDSSLLLPSFFQKPNAK